MSEISETKMHHLICAFCDNSKCVRGTEKCEFEQWKRQHVESEVKDADKEYEAKNIIRGNCMMCGKELDKGLFFCRECKAKAESEETDERG